MLDEFFIRHIRLYLVLCGEVQCTPFCSPALGGRVVSETETPDILGYCDLYIRVPSPTPDETAITTASGLFIVNSSGVKRLHTVLVAELSAEAAKELSSSNKC